VTLPEGAQSNGSLKGRLICFAFGFLFLLLVALVLFFPCIQCPIEKDAVRQVALARIPLQEQLAEVKVVVEAHSRHCDVCGGGGRISLMRSFLLDHKAR